MTTNPATAGNLQTSRPNVDFRPLVICHVWDSEYPWDVRVEKVSKSLTDHGHRVHLTARNRDGRQSEEKLAEATVHRMAQLPALGKKLNALSMFPAFFNPRWIGLVQQTCVQQKADLILCRDIPLAPTAIRVGRRLGLPVVLDMAENYPAMIAEKWEAGHQGALDWFVRNPSALAKLERWVLKKLDHTIVVVEESRDRLVRLGVPSDKITVASNTPSVARLEGPRTTAKAANEPIELYYLGIIETSRGIGVLLDALALCKRAQKKVTLSVFGDGREGELFRSRAKELQLDDMVTFHGFVPYPDALRAMKRADIGVVPHFVDENWNTTIPNKLFDYMAAGLPVLTSDARPTARIVSNTGCGAVFRDRDPADLAVAIEKFRDPAQRVAAGAAGQNAIASTFNWENDAARLINTIEKVAAQHKRR